MGLQRASVPPLTDTANVSPVGDHGSTKISERPLSVDEYEMNRVGA
jgi:hypothetical protein